MSVGEHGAKRQPLALGRGLSALLGDVMPNQGGSGTAIRDLRIGHVIRNPEQPRRHFDDDAMQELAESIASHGVLQPIVVREMPNGTYQIIAGERRWRAAQMAQLHEIPAIVRTADEALTLEISILENIQREQLNAIEEGQSYHRLVEEFGHSAEDVARLVHKSRSHVANLTRLLQLPKAVQDLVADGRLSMGHARALIGNDNAEALAQAAIAESLSVRQVEKRAKAARSPGIAKTARGRGEANADIAMLERQLSDILGLKVTITHDRRGGAVSLHYGTLDQLDMICQRLSGERI